MLERLHEAEKRKGESSCMKAFDIMTFILTLVSLYGVILNIRKERGCFYVWTATNASWAAVDLYKGIYAQAALFLIYFGLSIWGIYQWRHHAES